MSIQAKTPKVELLLSKLQPLSQKSDLAYESHQAKILELPYQERQ